MAITLKVLWVAQRNKSIREDNTSNIDTAKYV